MEIGQPPARRRRNNSTAQWQRPGNPPQTNSTRPERAELAEYSVLYHTRPRSARDKEWVTGHCPPCDALSGLRTRLVDFPGRCPTAIKLRNRSAQRWVNGRGIARVSWPYRPQIANACYPGRYPGLSHFRTFGARNGSGRYLLPVADFYFGHGNGVFFVNLILKTAMG